MIEVQYVCTGTCGAVLDRHVGEQLAVCQTTGCTQHNHALVKKYFCTRCEVHIEPDELKQHEQEG